MMLNALKRFICKILSEMVLLMFLKTSVLTLSFLTLIRFNHVNLPVHILSTYGEDCKNLFWKYGNVSKKLTKRRDDLEFLNLCKIYGLTPKFVRFKIYKRTLQNTKFYKSWQNKLLINEIKTCKNDIKNSQMRSIIFPLNYGQLLISLITFLFVNFLDSEIKIIRTMLKLPIRGSLETLVRNMIYHPVILIMLFTTTVVLANLPVRKPY